MILTIRQYILSVIFVCILSCILQLVFSGNRHMTPLIRLCAGMVLTLTVFMPLMQRKVTDFDFEIDDIVVDSKDVIEAGEDAALESLATIIKQNTQTYILEKAHSLGMDIQAEVYLRNDFPPVPYAVTVSGICTPFERKQLSYYLQQNLGIAEEHQRWIS